MNQDCRGKSALVRISQDAPPERRTVAIAVLSDLVRLGAASENALGRVSGAVSSNSALANLHGEVTTQLQRGGLKSTLDAAGIIRVPYKTRVEARHTFAREAWSPFTLREWGPLLSVTTPEGDRTPMLGACADDFSPGSWLSGVHPFARRKRYQ